MKTRFLTAVLALVSVFVVTSVCYAWVQPPNAILEAFREYVIVGRWAILDGSDSNDPDDSITKYEWDFTNNGSYDYSETSSSYPDGAFDGITTHIYDSNGPHTAKLRVTDGYSNTDTDTCTVNVGLDSDNDGMPDAWEELYPTILDPNDFNDADVDSDPGVGDGYSNLSEYLHSSDPNNSSSKPDPNINITIYVPSDVNTIQRAIYASIDGDTIMVSEGTYYEAIDFNGVSCALTSTDSTDWDVVANTIIDANDPNAGVVTFQNSEDANSLLKGFTITGGDLGIYCYEASPTISNCLITDNNSTSYGGGMYDCNSSPVVTKCVFSKNEAAYGGGIYDFNSTLALISCVFAENTADTDGGGMYNDDSSPIIINCTFSGNSAAGNGGGMYSYGVSDPNLTNCIFWDNDAVGSGDEIYNYDANSEPNFSYCDIKGGLNGPGCGGPNSVDDGGNINSAPYFIDINNPAGPDGIFGTLDDGLYMLIVSPCIDTGDPNTDSNDVGTVDLVGNARIVDGDRNDVTVIDMGAYELPIIWFVDGDANGSDDGKSWNGAFDDLQEALGQANDGDEIWVAEGTYKPTSGSNRSISFNLVEGVSIYGGFAGTETWRSQRKWTANQTILSGDIGTLDNQNDNSYHIVKGANNAILDGFTITGGNANGSGETTAGGGMYNSCCSPTVANCVFSQNNAYRYGGGLYNFESSPTVVNCIFSGNNVSSGWGGGMSNQPTSTPPPPPYYPATSSTPSNPTLVNCTFSGNSAGYGGGMNKGFDSTMVNCIFWGNDAVIDGNELYDTSGMSISYCDIKGSGGSDNWDPNIGINDGGNIDSDPCFIDVNNPDGNDGFFCSWDDGLRLDVNSPCIDAADGDAAPLKDILRLDHIDIAGVGQGVGDPDYVDIGAYESYKGVDSDGDGMPDDYEILHGLKPDVDDANGDLDGDGLSNLEEFQIGTWASNPDTDGDGMKDGWEYKYGLDPLDKSDATEDPDKDGKDNKTEHDEGSNPNIYNAITIIVYDYDDASDAIKETIKDVNDANVAVTEYQYDALGRKWQHRRWADADSSSNSNDVITLYSYDLCGNLTKTIRKGVGKTDPNNEEEGDLVTENFYNPLDRLTDVNDPCDGNTHYTYYPGGQVYEVNDPNGNVTTNYYDNAGRLKKVTDAEGHYRLNSYDSLGRTRKQIACDSSSNKLVQTRFEYNGLGQVTRRAIMADADLTDANAIDTTRDMVVDYAYDANDGNYPGLLVSETRYYHDGQSTQSAITYYDYDDLGRRTDINDPGGNLTLLTYNGMGQIIRRQQIEKDETGNNDLTITTDYWYDSLGRLHYQVSKPNNPDAEDDDSWKLTTYYYDALGSRTWEIRPDGVVTKYTYNALSQLKQKVADDGTSSHINQKTEYGYDRLGRQTSITGYADGSTAQTTTYTYDDLDRIKKITYPDSNDIDFEYNPAGKVIKRTDQRGIVTQYTYDSTYNMLAKYVDGNSATNDANEIFTYTGLGRILTATKQVAGQGTISETEFVYNDIGKITEANEALFGNDPPLEIRYTYDQAGHPNSVKYPKQSPEVVINITPDWQGRVKTLKLGATTLVTYKYVGSRVAQRSYTPPSPDVIYKPVYDNLGRIVDANSGASIARFTYEYDPNTNNITKQTYIHRTYDPCTDFTYDNLDRLTVAEYGIQDNNEVFTIDDLGNREKVNGRDGNDVTYSIDNLTNRYNNVGGNSLTYDAAGNLIADKDGYKYEYDYENRIVRIKDVNDVNVATFSYDALGRRIEKKDCIDASKTRRYYYNNNWQVLCEYDGSNNFKQWFAYGNYIDEVLIINTSNLPFLTRFYVHDHLYSPAALTSCMGTVLERYEYDAYGNCYILEPNFADDPDGKSDYENPYLFTGRRVDILDSGSLKIQYNRNRYYDYYTGRFATHDPLGIVPNAQHPNKFDIIGQYTDEMNLYEYANSNPVLGTDEYGLCVSPASSIKSAETVHTEAKIYQEMGDDAFNFAIDTTWISPALRVALLSPTAKPAKVWVQQLFRAATMSWKFNPGASKDAPGNRFVYTCKGGWIDVGHYMFSVTGAYYWSFRRSLLIGYGVELHQALHEKFGDEGDWAKSAFSPEDLYSNLLGSRTGADMSSHIWWHMWHFWSIEPYDIAKKLKEDLDRHGPVDPVKTVSGRLAKEWLEMGAKWTCFGLRHYWPVPVKMPLYHNCVCDENDNPK